jgi:magnesium chelatase accessory protein
MSDRPLSHLTQATPPAAFWGADPPLWQREGAGWPNREASRFIRAGGLNWHVQIMGDGPAVLLLHGTGAATHSWRDLAPLLAQYFTIIAPDLPGHGFTDGGRGVQMSVPGMAGLVKALLAKLDIKPAMAIGHSAGAAILVHMCLEQMIAPRALISLNGALMPYESSTSPIIGPVARMIARNKLLPRIFAWRAADRPVVENLLRSTGSQIDEAGIEFYARLARRAGHTGGALAMMGNWDLQALIKNLPKLKTPLLLVLGANDRSIPPADARRVQRKLPAARIVIMPGLGHLSHEEAPQATADLILDEARAQHVLQKVALPA